MECGGSSVVSKKGKKASSTRRTWNQFEEKILMDSLKELVANGHCKTENGFRQGYLQKLEQMIREKIPGTDIQASPHINSRVTIWKRHHACLQIALDGTGSGFNSITKVIDVSDTSWAKAVQKEPIVVGMRYKPWPFYYDWIEVFGCDGANGKKAEDVIDAVNELVQDDAQATCAESVPTVQEFLDDEFVTCDMDVESQTPTIETGNKTTSSLKRKRPSQSQSSNNKELFEGISDLFQESDDKLIDTVKKIGSDSQASQSRTNLYGVLEKIPELSLDERLDVAENLSRNPFRLEMFMGISENDRPRYVRRLLNGDFDKT